VVTVADYLRYNDDTVLEFTAAKWFLGESGDFTASHLKGPD